MLETATTCQNRLSERIYSKAAPPLKVFVGGSGRSARYFASKGQSSCLVQVGKSGQGHSWYLGLGKGSCFFSFCRPGVSSLKVLRKGGMCHSDAGGARHVL